MNRKILIGAYMALVAGLGACASVDFDHPRVESFAFSDTADTRIGRNVAGWGVIPEGHGGFHLLRDSVDALSARLVLAQRAERSIDAQVRGRV